MCTHACVRSFVHSFLHSFIPLFSHSCIHTHTYGRIYTVSNCTYAMLYAGCCMMCYMIFLRKLEKQKQAGTTSDGSTEPLLCGQKPSRTNDLGTVMRPSKPECGNFQRNPSLQLSQKALNSSINPITYCGGGGFSKSGFSPKLHALLVVRFEYGPTLAPRRRRSAGSATSSS